MANKLNESPPHTRAEQVIIIERSEGKGTEREPVRLVRYLHTLDGKLLGRLDAMDYAPSAQAAWYSLPF